MRSHLDSDFQVISVETPASGPRVVKLIDLDLGRRSVTNDADRVVEAVLAEHAHPAGVRIYYRDSMGRVDELVHDGRRFTGFAPAPGIVIDDRAPPRRRLA